VVGDTQIDVLVCMVCGSPESDAYDNIDNEDGVEVTWTYCRPCDAWTEHPPVEAPDAPCDSGYCFT
jgi:hypothetical protein